MFNTTSQLHWNWGCRMFEQWIFFVRGRALIFLLLKFCSPRNFAPGVTAPVALPTLRLWSYAEEEIPLKWVIQQDNDHKHIPTIPTYCFQTKRIEAMEWPAHSPRPHPSEKMSGDIKNAVSEAKPKNSQQLWNVVCSLLAEILVSRCQKLVDLINHLSKTMVIQLRYGYTN